ncbi:MAG: hypothetical protein INQ03_20235 [Candidatus Heimdallarchaeota archaeon]|nr:hypothetical protein [Candidatus Heimdallarchaeota archaeon]
MIEFYDYIGNHYVIYLFDLRSPISITIYILGPFITGLGAIKTLNGISVKKYAWGGIIPLILTLMTMIELIEIIELENAVVDISPGFGQLLIFFAIIVSIFGGVISQNRRFVVQKALEYPEAPSNLIASNNDLELCYNCEGPVDDSIFCSNCGARIR